MSANRLLPFHLLAFVIVGIWGTTFVSSKVLINSGLTPVDIFFYRFALAYVGIWFVAPRKLLSDSLADELLFILLGMTGGSIYFMLENTALTISPVANVSLIVCATPLFTMWLLGIGNADERLSGKQITGSVIAFVGMVLVVLNGKFAFKLSPVGDLLAFAAAWMWAFYSLLTKRLSKHYKNLFIIRKVFFYGLLTLLPVLAVTGLHTSSVLLTEPKVLLNLLFLGVVASLCCYVLWNVVMRRIGVVAASNYLYLNPVVAMITARIAIGERITLFAVIGMLLVLAGMYRAERK